MWVVVYCVARQGQCDALQKEFQEEESTREMDKSILLAVKHVKASLVMGVAE